MTPRIDPKTRAQNDFLLMLKTKRPDIFNRLMLFLQQRGDAFNGLSGLGETVPAATESNWWDKIISGLQTIVPTYAQYQMSRDLYSLNLERTKKGLPPIDASALSPQVQVGATPQTLMVIGALGIGLIWVLSRRRAR